MMQWAAMVMRNIYANARRPQSKRNRAEPFDCAPKSQLSSLLIDFFRARRFLENQLTIMEHYGPDVPQFQRDLTGSIL
jgi:hypothetical protein